MNRLSQQIASSEQTTAINNLKDKTQGLSYENNVAGLSGPSGGFLAGKKQALAWDAQGNLVIDGKVKFSGADLQGTLDGKQPKGDYVVTPTFNTYKQNVVEALKKLQPKGDYALREEVKKADLSLKGDITKVSDSLKDYQRKGDYALKNDLTNYQPKGDYAIKGDLNKYAVATELANYQRKGDYALTSALAKFQPKGDYILASAGPFLKKNDLDTFAKATDARFVSNDELKKFGQANREANEARFVSNDELKKFAKTTDDRFISNVELKQFSSGLKNIETKFLADINALKNTPFIKTTDGPFVKQSDFERALKSIESKVVTDLNELRNKPAPQQGPIIAGRNVLAEIDALKNSQFVPKGDFDRAMKEIGSGLKNMDVGLKNMDVGMKTFVPKSEFDNAMKQIGTGLKSMDMGMNELKNRPLSNGVEYNKQVDFVLGRDTAPERGPVGPARALVRDGGSALTINYDNDFRGGVNLNAKGGFRVGGDTTVSGGLTASGRNVLAEIDALKNRPVASGAAQIPDNLQTKTFVSTGNPDGWNWYKVAAKDGELFFGSDNANRGIWADGERPFTIYRKGTPITRFNADGTVFFKQDAFDRPAVQIGATNDAKDTNIYSLSFGKAEGGTYTGMGLIPNDKKAFPDTKGPILGTHIKAENEWGVFSDGWNKLFSIQGGSGNVKVKGTLDAANVTVGGKPLQGASAGAAFDGAMNDKQLKLRGAGDGNHYVAYTNNNNIDGARVQGHQGGQLGTNLGGDKTALQWDKDNNVFVNMSTNPLKFSSRWSGFPDGIKNGSEISNDTADYKKLMIIGNKSAGAERRVGIWDRLDVHGTLGVDGNAFIGDNVIMSGDNSWILHTPNDGRKQLYVAPGKDGGNWDWGKVTQFMPNGNIIASGNIDAAGFTIKGQPLASGGGGGAVDFDAFSNGNNAKFSAGWVVGGESYWDPAIRGPSRAGFAHTDKDGDAITTDRSADIQVPAGMKSGFLFHLPWSNCRHFDIWGVLGNGQEVFIRRVNAFQNVRTEQKDGLHDAAAVVPIPRVDRFAHIRIKGVRGRIHYMGTGWSKNNLASYASGADSGFISSQNIMGSALAIGDIPAPQDWTGANFRRRDGRWTHFDWKDDQRNYIRGNTVHDGIFSLQDNQLRLRDNGDGNHYLGFSGAVDGPRLQGHQGGQLGTNQGGDKTALTWNKTGVYISGNGGDWKAQNNQLCLGKRWCLRAEGANDEFLVFRDMEAARAGKDARYAMFPDRYVDINRSN
ncbi:MAG: hypothetical protein RLZZ86_1288 [Cyanobacteriota bacterium]|jgi:hypothetical protein